MSLDPVEAINAKERQVESALGKRHFRMFKHFWHATPVGGYVDEAKHGLEFTKGVLADARDFTSYVAKGARNVKARMANWVSDYTPVKRVTKPSVPSHSSMPIGRSYGYRNRYRSRSRFGSRFGRSYFGGRRTQRFYRIRYRRNRPY